MASIKKRPDGRWRARFRDPTGKEHAKHFARRVDAKRWLDETTAAVVVGQFVDPAAGRMTLREYAEQWRAAQVHRPSTQAHHETTLRRHVYPILGDKRLSAIPRGLSARPGRTGLHLVRRTDQQIAAHASASETLDTYSHLWPDSDDRTRDAIDSVLGAPADSLRTSEAAT
jgi:hypothetical protein